MASFYREADFTARYYGDCDFNNSNFAELARFSGAAFKRRGSFENTIFRGNANFEEAVFDELAAPASFRGAKFGGDARFHVAQFEGGADFSGAMFDGFAYWPDVKFARSVSFSDCQFNRPVTFARAHFVTEFPEFANTALHATTTFTVDDDLWPKTSAKTAESDRDTLKVIRHSLSKQGLPEEEHYFFRREMYANSLIGPFWRKFPYQAFGWLADFGHSIARPLVSLGILLLLGGFLYSFHFAEGLFGLANDHDWREKVRNCGILFFQSLFYSFANVFSFLGIQRLYLDGSVFQEMSMFLKWFAGLQALAGVFLLFLLGLGLRTRFRLR